MDKIQEILNIRLPEKKDINIKHLLPESNFHSVNLEYIVKTHSSWFLETELLTQEINQKGRDIVNHSRNIMLLGLNRSGYKKEKWWKDYDFFWQNIIGALLKTLRKFSTEEGYKKIFNYYKGAYITDLFKGYFFVNWVNISKANEFIKRLEINPKKLYIIKTCKYLLKEELKVLNIEKIIIIGGTAYSEFKKMFRISKDDIKLSISVLSNEFKLKGKNIEIYQIYHYGQSARDNYRKQIPGQLLDIARIKI